MAIGLDEIVTAQFRATADADGMAQIIKDRLGFGAFNVPARLAIARSLAIASPPPPLPRVEMGRVIKGEALFGTGTDLAAWTSLIVEHAGRAPEDMKAFQALVAAHWTRGLGLISEALIEAKGESSAFWTAIARTALPEGQLEANGQTEDDILPPGVIAVGIGPVSEDAATGETILWRPNAAGGSPHAALMGGVGSGKTRTAIGMLKAIRARTPVPIIAFDFKGDMTDNANALDVAFGATVIAPPHQTVPLDFLAQADRSAIGISLAAQRLRDSLTTLRGSRYGDRQKDALSEAAERTLRTGRACGLVELRDALKAVYAERSMKEDGAVTNLNDLCRLPLFRPEMDPKTFFSRSWIIRLTQDIPDLVKVTIVTLITDALDRHLNSQSDAATDFDGNRALRVLCVIDEAHRILGVRLPGLSGLIRLSRSKGGAVMLISQSPDDFAGEDDDFLSEMGFVAAFATNANPTAVRRILGPGANLAVLEKGQAWTKLRGEAAARRIVAWK